jgi:hypothetical protein
MKKNSASPAPNREPTEAEIQKVAYLLWLEGGCREGVELDNWLSAKELLLHHSGRDGGRTQVHASPASLPAAAR